MLSALLIDTPIRGKSTLNLIDAAKLVVRGITRQQPFGCFHRMSTIHSQSGMSAVMQQNDMTVNRIRFDTLSRIALDGIGRGLSPIEAGHIPRHRFEFEFARDVQNGRTASAKRWTKVAWLNSRGIGNCFRAIC